MLLYRLLVALLLPLVVLRLAIKALKQPAYLVHIKQRFGYTPARTVDVWIHAVSVGEACVAITLLARLRSVHPQLRYVITTTTPTGKHTLAPVLDDEHVFHSYCPLDSVGCMQRFMNRAKPRVLLIIETEIWPTMLCVAQQCHCPAVLINGRLSARSCAGYQRWWLRSFVARVFNRLDFIVAQSYADADRYRQLGFAGTVTVCGNIKFDAQDMLNIEPQQQYPDRIVWLALSVRDGELDAIVEAADAVRRAVPSSQCIIVPRHLHLVQQAITNLQDTHLRHAVVQSPAQLMACAHNDVVLVDAMGVVAEILSQVDYVFVGGSIAPLGGQNMLEPIAQGKPTCIGQHYFNFQAIVDGLRSAEGIVLVSDAASIAAQLVRWHSRYHEVVALVQNAQQFYRNNQGATKRTCEALVGYAPFAKSAASTSSAD